MALPSKQDLLTTLRTSPRHQIDTCAICLEPSQEAIETACHHFYCIADLEAWLESSNSCPTCRTALYPSSPDFLTPPPSPPLHHFLLPPFLLLQDYDDDDDDDDNNNNNNNDLPRHWEYVYLSFAAFTSCFSAAFDHDRVSMALERLPAIRSHTQFVFSQTPGGSLGFDMVWLEDGDEGEREDLEALTEALKECFERDVGVLWEGVGRAVGLGVFERAWEFELYGMM